MRVFALVLLAAVGSGCHWNLNDPGTEPLVSQLYFPSGIAMDPSGNYAWVSNGNADLKYGGGSLQMIDVRRFECAVEYARKVRFALDPGGMAGLSAACTNADQMKNDTAFPWAQQDPLDPTIVDIDESPFIIPNATIKLGNFAGSVRLMTGSPPLADNQRRLFVAVRGDPSITYFDVDLSKVVSDTKSTANGDLNASPVGVVSCFANPNAFKKDGNGIIINPSTCDADHLLQLFNCRVGGTASTNPGAGFPFCPAGTDDVGDLQLPVEPFGMQLDQPLDRSYAHLLISHLSSGQVSLIDAGDSARMGKPTLDSTSSQFFQPTSSGLRGAFMLAPQHPGQWTSTWYMTSNQLPLISTFHVADVNEIVPQGAFSLQSTFVVGNDMRDLIFDVGGDRAFITGNDPPALITLDTSTVPEGQPGAGQPRDQVVSVVDICQTPSHMGLLRQLVMGADGTPSRVKTKLIVVCFLSSQVMIVDPDRPGVDDTIYSGFSGPDDIAFTFADPRGAPGFESNTSPWQHAWITNYTESTISVIELQPGSHDENRVIARLGYPQGGPQRGVTQ